MNRTKYDGKLTDALIQTVVDAEMRHNGLETHPNDATGDSVSGSHGEPISQLDAIVSHVIARPTPTEQAEAWRRNHYDEEGEPENK